jgi:hypothetical protein
MYAYLGRFMVGSAMLAACGAAGAADSYPMLAGQHIVQAADTAGGHAQDSAAGTDSAGDTGSPGTQSGENPGQSQGAGQDSMPRAGDSAGGPNAGSDTAGETGSQGTQSGQNPRENPSEAFAAEMRRCGSMAGDDKRRCETDARKKHGQM